MNENRVNRIDLVRILKMLWKKKVLIAAASVMCALITVFGAAVTTVPQYQADILVYVNNSSISLGSNALSFSLNELSAAKLLLNSYVVALKSRACLDEIIEKAGLSYSREQLKQMISAEDVNETEWFTITVKSPDPEESKLIADTIAEILPKLLSETIKGSSVEIVDSAIKPEKQSSLGYTSYGEIGFLIGFFAIIIILILIEILDDKIKGEETLSEISETIPILANISHKGLHHNYKSGYEYGQASKKVYSKKTVDDVTAICGELDFAVAESYKLLQTSVQYTFENGGCKVIGITSSDKNEGKSTVAVNLAYMLSCDKKRVLLLDGDMRLPSIAKKLGIESTPGLSDYLTGKAKNNEGIQYSEKAHDLSVICAGVVPPNPFGLLNSANMERLISALKNTFDYIIVDLPPVNIVSDPLAVAKCLDGFIVVVRTEYSTRKGVRKVIEKLQVVNSNIIGYVINGNGSSTSGKREKNGR